MLRTYEGRLSQSSSPIISFSDIYATYTTDAHLRSRLFTCLSCTVGIPAPASEIRAALCFIRSFPSRRHFTLTSPHHDDYGIGPQPRATATMSNTRFKPLFPRAFPVTPESVMPTSTISGTYHVMYQRARAGKPRAWTSDGILLASSQVWQYYETKEAWNSGAAILGT